MKNKVVTSNSDPFVRYDVVWSTSIYASNVQTITTPTPRAKDKDVPPPRGVILNYPYDKLIVVSNS